MLKFYTAATAETSSETKFMTVSKKVGKDRDSQKIDHVVTMDYTSRC